MCDISEYLIPLERFGKIGKVHSCFDHSFNLAVGEQLINIGSYRDYLSSFGIFLPESLFMEVRPYAKIGNVVKLSNHMFRFYDSSGVFELSLMKRRTVALKTEPVRVEKENLLKVIRILEKEQLLKNIGLVPSEKEFEICDQLVNDASPDWSAITTHLIGRGKGLTPSGDDLLVAYLFVMNILWQERAQKLASALDQTLSTTDVSSNYLKTCIEGYVSSPIYNLYTVMKQQPTSQSLETAIKQILQIGHTSGKDMGLGLLLGLKAIVNKAIRREVPFKLN